MRRKGFVVRESVHQGLVASDDKSRKPQEFRWANRPFCPELVQGLVHFFAWQFIQSEIDTIEITVFFHPALVRAFRFDATISWAGAISDSSANA